MLSTDTAVPPLHRFLKPTIAALVAACLAAAPVRAQSVANVPSSQQQAVTQTDATPDTDYAPPAPKAPERIPSTGFVMPDAPDAWNRATSYQGRLFTTGLSIVPIIDYSAFVQDKESKAQVGEQNDEWDVRTLRLMTRGRIKF